MGAVGFTLAILYIFVIPTRIQQAVDKDYAPPELHFLELKSADDQVLLFDIAASLDPGPEDQRPITVVMHSAPVELKLSRNSNAQKVLVKSSLPEIFISSKGASVPIKAHRHAVKVKDVILFQQLLQDLGTWDGSQSSYHLEIASLPVFEIPGLPGGGWKARYYRERSFVTGGALISISFVGAFSDLCMGQ